MQPLAYAGIYTLPPLDNRGRARRAVLTLRIFTIFYILLFAVQFPLSIVIERRAAQGQFGPDLLLLSLLLGVLSLFGLALFTVAIVFYMMWQYRAFERGRRAARVPAYGPGWSVAWWFIPIANLFVPRRILAELWRISGAGQASDEQSRPRTIYTLWLLTFLLAMVSLGVDIANDFRLYTALYWVAFAIGMASTACWLAFLLKLASFVRIVEDHQSASPGR